MSQGTLSNSWIAIGSPLRHFLVLMKIRLDRPSAQCVFMFQNRSEKYSVLL